MPGGKPGNPGNARAERRRHPAVMVNAAAAHDLEILGVLHLRRLRVVERAGEADAVDRVLRNAIDHAGRCDAEDFVDGRNDVVHMQELRRAAWHRA